jgi:AraC-like DNA-binding protein
MSESHLPPDVKSDPAVTTGESTPHAPLSPLPLVLEDRLMRVLEIVESQPGVSAHELASAVGLGPTHLQRLFKRATGLDVHELLAERRCQAAAHMLAAGDKQVKEIAHVVGYEHAPSFVRAFQRRFGQTPGLYRKQNGRAASSSKPFAGTASTAT